MEKLLAIQQKLKTKTVKEEQEKSFVSGNIIKSSNQGKTLAAKVSAPQSNRIQPASQTQANQSSTKVAQKQDTIAANSFWATGSSKTASNPKSNAGNEVAFDDFFGGPSTKPQQQAQPKTQAPNHNDMYDFFFPGND